MPSSCDNIRVCLEAKGNKVTISWVKGHAGLEGNERAEALYGRSGFEMDGRKLMSRWIR